MCALLSSLPDRLTMTHRIPRIAVNVRVVKAEALYSLFKKVDGKWNRDRSTAFPLKYAMRIFGDLAVKNPYTYSIQAIEVECNRAQSKSNHFSSGCSRNFIKEEHVLPVDCRQ